jgi:hypothetical protein
MESDPDPSRPCRSCGPVGDDLKQHGLLVGGAMDRRRAQDTHIVGLTQEAHQVVNEPVCRWAPHLPVFHRDYHVKAPAGTGDPALLLESPQGRLQGHGQPHGVSPAEAIDHRLGRIVNPHLRLHDAMGFDALPESEITKNVLRA